MFISWTVIIVIIILIVSISGNREKALKEKIEELEEQIDDLENPSGNTFEDY
jgi:hypothetical protein